MFMYIQLMKKVSYVTVCIMFSRWRACADACLRLGMRIITLKLQLSCLPIVFLLLGNATLVEQNFEKIYFSFDYIQ